MTGGIGPARPPSFLRLLDLPRHDSGRALRELGKRTIFILSTGRTGTKFLAELFDRHPAIRALHEPKPSRGLRFWTTAFLQGEVDKAAMTGALRRYRSGFFDDMSEPIYVESNNFLAGFAESLIEEFDDPVIVHVIRDPRTYVRSAINKGADSGMKGLANKYLPYAHLPLDSKSEHAVIQRSALFWTLVNSHLGDVGEGYPGYHLFEYENLFSDDTSHIERLARLVGVDEKEIDSPQRVGRVNESPRNLLGPWDQWTADMQQVVIDTCGDVMARFGYET